MPLSAQDRPSASPPPREFVLEASSDAPASLPRRAKLRADRGTWVNSADYPSFYLRQEVEGVTRVRIQIGADGRVSACSVDRSSGIQMLDELTCLKAVRRARYYPALDANGQPTTDVKLQTVKWRIPDDDYENEMRFGLTPTGNPALWITNNPWANAPAKMDPSKQTVVQTRRIFKLLTDASGRVNACSFFGNERAGRMIVDTNTKKNDALICAQYRARGKFVSEAGQSRVGTYYAHIGATVVFAPGAY